MRNPDPKSHVPRATRPPRPRRHAAEHELDPALAEARQARRARAERAGEFYAIARRVDRRIGALLAELELDLVKLDAAAAELEAYSVRLLRSASAELVSVKYTVARACDASALLLVRAERVRDEPRLVGIVK